MLMEHSDVVLNTFINYLMSIHCIMIIIILYLAYFLLSAKKIKIYQNPFNGLIKQYNIFNFRFKPHIIFVYFETSIQKEIRLTWSLAIIKGHRFHLGQSWWRKMQSLWLSTDFKDKDSDIGKFLTHKV